MYELVRKFAGATRKLSMFDCKGCVEELEKLPWGQQRSCMVVAMVARANYERQEYHAVCFFLFLKMAFTQSVTG